MAEKISVQIALEGGAEIERQLADIGEAGQKAFADISKSAEQAGGFKQLDPKDVTAKLQEMGVTGVDAINKIQAAVQKAGQLETLAQGIQTAETALKVMAVAAVPVGAAIVTAMNAAAKATIAFAGEVNKINTQAIKLGAGIEQVDKFRAALEKAGVSAESIGQILQSKLASEQGIKGLEAFIRSLEQMPDSASRSKAAVQEFGQAGAELIRILQAGGKLTGFAVGGLISAEDAKRATELGQAINSLESSIARLNTLGFAPALTTGINVATGAVELLGARLQQAPWQTALIGAQLAFNPIPGLVNVAIAALTAVKPAVDQIGIATQQSSQLFTQWGTTATTASAGVATAAQQAGQQASGLFTAWGTSADAATAKTQTFSSSLASIAWDTISGAGVAAWNALVTAVQWAGTAVTDFASKLLTIAWDTISGLGVAAWNALTGAIQGAINALLQFIGLKPSAPATGEGAPGKARGGLLGGRGTGTSDSNLAWVSRGEHIMPARVVRQPGVLSLLEALRRSGRIPGFAEGGAVGGGGGSNVFVQLGQALIDIDNNVSALGQEISALESYIGATNAECKDENAKTRQKIDENAQYFDEFFAALMGKAENLEERASDAFKSLAAQHAGGGLLGGRGTGTSDSNLAWVSRGEYVTPARAVAQPGVLAFLEALRRSGGNLGRVLDGMGRFALGGMVPRPMMIPAFAGGGLAGGGNHVTIQFPGLPPIGGLRASSAVVDELHRAAALAQVRSGGRKPSRYS